MWKDLYAPDYSVLGATAHRVLEQLCARGHKRLRLGVRQCRSCWFRNEMDRQKAALELEQHWHDRQAEQQLAAVELERYWPTWQRKRECA